MSIRSSCNGVNQSAANGGGSVCGWVGGCANKELTCLTALTTVTMVWVVVRPPSVASILGVVRESDGKLVLLAGTASAAAIVNAKLEGGQFTASFDDASVMKERKRENNVSVICLKELPFRKLLSIVHREMLLALLHPVASVVARRTVAPAFAVVFENFLKRLRAVARDDCGPTHGLWR